MLWLIGHIDALASHVVFPSVVRAADTAFLVATEPERDAAVRAELVHQGVASIAVAERDQPLREELHADRRAVVLRELLGQQRRQPIASEHPAERRFRPSLGQ